MTVQVVAAEFGAVVVQHVEVEGLVAPEFHDHVAFFDDLPERRERVRGQRFGAHDVGRRLGHLMDRTDDRLRELGLTLYGPHPPHDPLDAVVVHDGIARTSGQLPRIDGQLTCLGVLGAEVTVEEGYEAARVCALNALAVLKAELGTLDRIGRILTVTGYVASAPGFDQQPAVIDGASHVLHAIFGDAGRHTRSAIGVAALPRGGAVEIEVIAAVRPA
jgi:enamine deaminase RidA (YjgF/YER057c/UK114 family)